MRRIHIKFTNSTSVAGYVGIDYGGKPIMRIRNRNGYQVVLRNPVLCKRIVGVFIQTDDGGLDRWMNGTDISSAAGW